jgi:iron(III) transport system ATP-binding protein
VTAPALIVEGVTKRFRSVVAVSDVHLTLEAGELLALVGPSGCGKSTLLRLIAGLHRAEEGSITLGDRVVDDGRRALAPERRHLGLVFQDHSLFPHLTVGANVGFGLRYGAGTGRGTTDRVTEVLTMVGLDGHADRYPHELSGGERQRVALARALAPSPALVLLDEPFASLDPNLRAQVRRDVVGILRDTATPAVLVTHDQAEALAVADRVAVMGDGSVEQVGAPEEVFHRPRTQFVASLMGEAAFLPVTAGGGLAVPLAGARCRPGDLDGRDPEAVLAMIRPDDVVVGAGGSTGRIVSTEFRGASWAYSIELGSGHRVLAESPHIDHHPVGSTVAVAMAPGHVPAIVERS